MLALSLIQEHKMENRHGNNASNANTQSLRQDFWSLRIAWLLRKTFRKKKSPCGEMEKLSPGCVPGEVGCAVARRKRGESQVHRTGSRTESSGTWHRGATERFIPKDCPDVPKRPLMCPHRDSGSGDQCWVSNS